MFFFYTETKHDEKGMSVALETEHIAKLEDLYDLVALHVHDANFQFIPDLNVQLLN
jgi:hypothetical protein